MSGPAHKWRLGRCPARGHSAVKNQGESTPKLRVPTNAYNSNSRAWRETMAAGITMSLTFLSLPWLRQLGKRGQAGEVCLLLAAFVLAGQANRPDSTDRRTFRKARPMRLLWWEGSCACSRLQVPTGWTFYIALCLETWGCPQRFRSRSPQSHKLDFRSVLKRRARFPLPTGPGILASCPFAYEGVGVDERARVTTCATQPLGFPPIEITGLSKQPSISCKKCLYVLFSEVPSESG